MLVEANIWTVARTDRGNAVLIKVHGSEKAVPIIIHQLEAQSILIGLSNVSFVRPLTHDLMVSLASKVSMKIIRVEITDIRDDIFYARLIFKSKGRRVMLDARPSDALSIVARSNCPLYISESVIEEAGVYIGTITGEDVEDKKSEFDSEQNTFNQLQDELQKAVDEENYEEAARIRDKIQDINTG